MDDIPNAAFEIDVARRDHVGANVLGREIAGERFDIGHQRRLCRRIRARRTGDLDGAGRSDHDDRAGRRLLEERDRRLDPGDGAHDVDLQAAPPGIVVHALRQRADIGDEDVETAERVGCLGDPPAQPVNVGDIDPAAPGFDAVVRQPRHSLVHCGLMASAQRDVAALGRQQLGDGTPDAARAAGDDRVLAFEIEIHAALLSVDVPVL